MTLTAIEIAGYRSIRSIRFPVRKLSVLVGGNGVGKTNLYRSLELLHAAARGTLAEEIAREGGLASIFWAGDRKTHEQPRLVLEAALEEILPGASAGMASLPLTGSRLAFHLARRRPHSRPRRSSRPRY